MRVTDEEARRFRDVDGTPTEKRLAADLLDARTPRLAGVTGYQKEEIMNSDCYENKLKHLTDDNAQLTATIATAERLIADCNAGRCIAAGVLEQVNSGLQTDLLDARRELDKARDIACTVLRAEITRESLNALFHRYGVGDVFEQQGRTTAIHALIERLNP